MLLISSLKISLPFFAIFYLAMSLFLVIAKNNKCKS